MILKHYITTICINVIYIPLILCTFQLELVKEYFKINNIPRAVLFTCGNDYIIAERLMKEDIFVTLYKLVGRTENVTQLIVPHGQQGFVLDTACEDISELLHYCAEQNLFYDKYKWLVFSDTESAQKTLSDMRLGVNAEVIMAVPRSEIGWQLLEVWGPNSNQGAVEVRTWGTWHPIHGFTFSHNPTEPKYIRRKNLHGIKLTGMIVLTSNYTGELLDYLYNNDENRTIDNFARYYFLLIDHVRDIHNFTFTTLCSEIYGSITSNGSFNGLVGFLQRKEVDLALCSIYFKNDRIPYVDYLIPTYLMKTRFLFLRPTPRLSILGSFFSPLSRGAWLCTGAVAVLLAILLRHTFRHECALERERAAHELQTYTEYDWSYVALLVFGGLCQQDVPHIPNLYSSRTVVFISVFFTYMLYQFYSGGIVSSLLSEPPDVIKDLSDLLHSDLHIGVEDIIYEKDYFQQTTDPLAIELYKTKVQGKRNGSDAFYDVTTGMALVQLGGFAFQTDTSTGYAVVADRFTTQQTCELREVELYPNQLTYGVLQQDSPYKEMMLYSFQRMVEAGLVQRQRMKWTSRRPVCLRAPDSSDIYVSLKQFFPAILFYMVGMILSLVIFAGELWMSKRNFIY